MLMSEELLLLPLLSIDIDVPGTASMGLGIGAPVSSLIAAGLYRHLYRDRDMCDRKMCDYGHSVASIYFFHLQKNYIATAS